MRNGGLHKNSNFVRDKSPNKCIELCRSTKIFFCAYKHHAKTKQKISNKNVSYFQKLLWSFFFCSYWVFKKCILFCCRKSMVVFVVCLGTRDWTWALNKNSTTELQPHTNHVLFTMIIVYIIGYFLISSE